MELMTWIPGKSATSLGKGGCKKDGRPAGLGQFAGAWRWQMGGLHLIKLEDMGHKMRLTRQTQCKG